MTGGQVLDEGHWVADVVLLEPAFAVDDDGWTWARAACSCGLAAVYASSSFEVAQRVAPLILARYHVAEDRHYWALDEPGGEP